MSLDALYWDASYEIVCCLIDTYPDIIIDDVGIDELYKMIVALPNFADDPALANEGILNAILREWYEEKMG
ncbi:MAG: Fe-S cluster assembly protein IscX [Anaerolineae bacterium]|nr:Fe-S cluster assembly protein IscX [Anaerolineae bacterium]MCB9459975.1 Fe-S cluster assembly protein IscX [Anaerolineaceae bacterium]